MFFMSKTLYAFSKIDYLNNYIYVNNVKFILANIVHIFHLINKIIYNNILHQYIAHI